MARTKRGYPNNVANGKRQTTDERTKGTEGTDMAVNKKGRDRTGVNKGESKNMEQIKKIRCKGGITPTQEAQAAYHCPLTSELS